MTHAPLPHVAEPLVTVIIPTHDRAALLMRAVTSALGQTHGSLEVLVVDDGSTDETPALLAAVDDPRLTVIRRQTPGGVSAARNVAIAAARGDFIALLDSDDEWLPDKTARQLAYMLENGHIISQTQEIWMRGGRRVNPVARHGKPDGFFFEAALDMCLVSPSTTMFARGFFEEVGLFDESLPACEDYDLWLRTLLRHPIGLLDAYLAVRHGGRGDQLSTMFIGQDLFRIRAMIGLLARPEVTPWHRDCIEKELRRKVRVYVVGCCKRDRPEEAERVLALMETALGAAKAHDTQPPAPDGAA
ncbi:glycosyltransferase family 2 protein [Desulfovibrio sp. TomC]|uniref:glycosyltransferase family 2 protein n=1 Tax=Desulfovibrio sp. TomC TaxID=1562888 RepID=UPI00064CF1E7|nr:glycosyltransferase family A protein [Desulfovibrio sp. TomC]